MSKEIFNLLLTAATGSTDLLYYKMAAFGFSILFGLFSYLQIILYQLNSKIESMNLNLIKIDVKLKAIELSNVVQAEKLTSLQNNSLFQSRNLLTSVSNTSVDYGAIIIISTFFGIFFFIAIAALYAESGINHNKTNDAFLEILKYENESMKSTFDANKGLIIDALTGEINSLGTALKLHITNSLKSQKTVVSVQSITASDSYLSTSVPESMKTLSEIANNTTI